MEIVIVGDSCPAGTCNYSLLKPNSHESVNTLKHIFEIGITMNRKSFYDTVQKICLAFLILVLTIQRSNSQTFCTSAGTDRIAGEQEGYWYEIWNQNAQGTACMTLGSEALFSGEWNGIYNYLARRGLKYDETQEHQEIGTFYSTYNCIYNPNSASGNSYLSVYGWTVEPLAEFYIIEDWRNWIPSMDANAVSRGTIEANGSIYDIIENTRVNQPSIKGITTFQQYFSIRRNNRNNGTINISEHFNMWETLGMNMGKMYEVSYVVEGYQSSGSFEFTELDVFLGDDPLSVTGGAQGPACVSIYPNPNSGSVSVKLDESVLNVSMKIYDASGRIIFSQENINNNLLKVSNLKSGIYFVNVINDRLNYKTKFLVL